MVESSDRTWSTGEGNGKPLQYSCLENPMNILSCERMFLSSLSRHNKELERRTLKRVTALGSWTNHVIALKQISVTALFYLEGSRRERESER